MVLSSHKISMPMSIVVFILSGPVLGLILGLLLEFYEQQSLFTRQAGKVVSEIETRVNTYNVALEGFANFLAVSKNRDQQQIRAYTQGILEIYPEIYMIEIARYVPHKDRDAFEIWMKLNGYPDFTIHSFDYDSTRRVIPAKKSAFYYPISFSAPYSEEKIKFWVWIWQVYLTHSPTK